MGEAGAGILRSTLSLDNTMSGTGNVDIVAQGPLLLGGGNAGQAVAFRTAAAGKRTALVDKGDVAGLCALRGCNPKKVMVRATEVLDEVRRAGLHGVVTGSIAIDWNRVIDRVHSFT